MEINGSDSMWSILLKILRGILDLASPLLFIGSALTGDFRIVLAVGVAIIIGKCVLPEVQDPFEDMNKELTEYDYTF